MFFAQSFISAQLHCGPLLRPCQHGIPNEEAACQGSGTASLAGHAPRHRKVTLQRGMAVSATYSAHRRRTMTSLMPQVIDFVKALITTSAHTFQRVSAPKCINLCTPPQQLHIVATCWEQKKHVNRLIFSEGSHAVDRIVREVAASARTTANPSAKGSIDPDQASQAQSCCD
jgi:hypothetical protein